MTEQILNHNVTPVATLTGLSPLVVQGINFNNSFYSSEYVVQYSESKIQTTISVTNDTDNLDWNATNGNTPLAFHSLTSFDAPLSGHTQTLMQGSDLLLTGSRQIIFKDLADILNNATQEQRDDFYNNASNTTNASWITFNKFMNGTLPPLIKNKFNWAKNFIALPNSVSHGTLYNGQYINVIGTDAFSSVALRSELADTPDHNQFLLAINDDDTNNLHLLVFNINLLDTLGYMYDDITETMAAYWDGDGYPTADKANESDEFRQEALDFYQAILENNDLVFDLSEHEDTITKRIDLTTDDFNTHVGYGIKNTSFQGFGLDNQSNIYIASGFGPSSSHIVAQNHIYKISNNTWYDLNCEALFGESTTDVFPEIENMQVLSENRLLVAVATHKKQTDGSMKTTKNQVYRVSWE